MKHTAAAICLAALAFPPAAGAQSRSSAQPVRATAPKPISTVSPRPQPAPTGAIAEPSTPSSPVGTSGSAASTGDDKQLPPAVPVAGDYRLGPGDKLRIEVYKDEQLSQSVQIRPDGKITLPLVGDISATGQTPIELRDQIATSLRDYVRNPVVTVIVVEALASQVFVMGEVERPGAVQMHGPITIMQALALAGGFRPFADQKDVRVLRRTASGVQTLRFNYKEAVDGGMRPLELRAGDTVVVK